MHLGDVKTLHTGRVMPALGLGTWRLTKHTPQVIQDALALGYTMIDTSGDYGTQPGIAEGLRRAKVPRKSYYIVTKVEETDDAYQAVKANLSELRLKYADLILIHRPPPRGIGEELWAGLIRAKNEGLTKDIGVSNYAIRQIRDLAEQSGEWPVVNQIEWSPFGWDEDMLDFCRQHDIVIQAYSPLTHGRRMDDEALADLAVKYDKSPAQLLIRWCLQIGVVPLPKANQRRHLEENIEVFDFEIDDEDMDYLSSLNEGYSAL